MIFNIFIALCVLAFLVFTVLAVATFIETKALRLNKTTPMWVTRINDFMARYPFLFN